MRSTPFAAISVVALSLATTGGAEPYEPASDLVGEVTIAGSDTLFELTEAWIETFRGHHPDVVFSVAHEGSATAPAALESGVAALGAMSRPMDEAEAASVREGAGSAPTEIIVALDALAVFVSERSPLRGVTMEELDGIFSAGTACGGRRYDSWRDVAIGVPDEDFRLHGRDELSGSYATFRERALCGGAFDAAITVHPDSPGVVEAVAADPLAIGYSGLGYDTEGVRPLAIGVGDAEDPGTRYYPYIVERFAESDDVTRKYAWVVRGDYPLSRPLRFYFTGEPDPATAAFLAFALSDEGQAIVEEVGFVPLPPASRDQSAAKLDS